MRTSVWNITKLWENSVSTSLMVLYLHGIYKVSTKTVEYFMNLESVRTFKAGLNWIELSKLVSLVVLLPFVDQFFSLTFVWYTSNNNTSSSFALLIIVNIHTKAHRGRLLIRKTNGNLYLCLYLPSSPWVEDYFQVFVVMWLLSAVCHCFLCISSVNGRYFEQKT